MRRSGWHNNLALRQLSDALGDLPATYTSTARGQHDPRRQHLYRVPPGTELETTLTGSSTLGGVTLAGDIEIPAHGHRYSVVWPSVHPDTGQLYRWYDLGGQPMDGPPAVADLPYLPEAWLAALDKGARVLHDGKPSGPPPRPYGGSVEGWLGERPNGAVSPAVARALQPYLDGAPFRGHQVMVSLQKHLVLLAGECHHGVPLALEFARAAWLESEHTPGEDPAREFDDALEGVVKKYGGEKA